MSYQVQVSRKALESAKLGTNQLRLANHAMDVGRYAATPLFDEVTAPPTPTLTTNSDHVLVRYRCQHILTEIRNLMYSVKGNLPPSTSFIWNIEVSR